MPFVSVNLATATALRVLSGAVTLLLLIAIANASNIVLAETVRRDAELAVRASLGASWLRLVRQIMCETLLVSALAAIIGLIVSTWALKVNRQISAVRAVRIDLQVTSRTEFRLAGTRQDDAGFDHLTNRDHAEPFAP